jgi:hypothetical protein
MIVKRRLTRKTSAKPGAREGAFVAGWLNDESVSAGARQKVTELLRDLIALGKTPDFWQPWPKQSEFARLRASGVSGKTPLNELVPLIREWDKFNLGPNYDYDTIKRVESFLASIRFQPVFWAVSSSSRKKASFRLRMVPALTAKRGINGAESANLYPDPLKSIDYASPNEAKAWIVLLVTQLANLSAVNRIRQCACGQWFYATRPDKRSCSAACRKESYEKTDKRRKTRGPYMQKYMKKYREGSKK